MAEAYGEIAALKSIENPKVTVLFLFLGHAVGLFPRCCKLPSCCCVRLLNVGKSAQGHAGLLHCRPCGVSWSSQIPMPACITAVLVGWMCNLRRGKILFAPYVLIMAENSSLPGYTWFYFCL